MDQILLDIGKNPSKEKRFSNSCYARMGVNLCFLACLTETVTPTENNMNNTKIVM